MKSAIKKRKDCLAKLDRKISRNHKKDQKLLNIREELANEVKSYTQRCSDFEKKNLEKIESLQKTMFKGSRSNVERCQFI